MKTRLYIIAVLSGLFLFACNNEKDEPKTRTDAVEEEVTETTENPICFSCMSIEQATDAYDYPLKPGSEAMKNASPSDKTALNQVPNEVLKTMSTKGLVQSVLTFPTIFDWGFSNYSYYHGFLSLTEQITIFKELYGRSDAATTLLETYKLFDPYACQGGTLALQTMDMLIAQPEIYTKLSGKEVPELIKAAIDKIESQPEVNEEGVLWWFGDDKLFLMGRVMYHAGYKPFIDAVDANECLTNYLEREDTSFMSSVNQFGGPEKFQEFFMTHAKAFLNQGK